MSKGVWRVKLPGALDGVVGPLDLQFKSRGAVFDASRRVLLKLLRACDLSGPRSVSSKLRAETQGFSGVVDRRACPSQCGDAKCRDDTDLAEAYGRWVARQLDSAAGKHVGAAIIEPVLQVLLYCAVEIHGEQALQVSLEGFETVGRGHHLHRVLQQHVC